MLKKVKITVISSVRDEDEKTPERTEEHKDGYIKYDDSGVSLISFKTKDEGGEFTTELFKEGASVRLVRRGAIFSEIVFDEGKEHSSVYKVPPLSFDMTVKTRTLDWRVGEEGGTLTLLYSMEIGGARRLAAMEITVRVV